jgi:hypothetical protein
MNAQNRNEERDKRKSPSQLDEVLERRILLYVLAAGAALAGVASPLQAKVVFTRSRALVQNGDTLQIDLNNDGTNDFRIWVGTSQTTSGLNRVPHNYGFLVQAAGSASADLIEGSFRDGVVALKHGEKIGSGATFDQGGLMAFSNFNSGFQESTGPFANTRGRFLGVRFLISGQVHYGWIGFRHVKGREAKLLGWAYETEPNTPIRAGQGILGGNELSSAGPTSLELLAAGHVAVAEWRRRGSAVQPISSAS